MLDNKPIEGTKCDLFKLQIPGRVNPLETDLFETTLLGPKEESFHLKLV